MAYKIGQKRELKGQSGKRLGFETITRIIDKPGGWKEVIKESTFDKDSYGMFYGTPSSQSLLMSPEGKFVDFSGRAIGDDPFAATIFSNPEGALQEFRTTVDASGKPIWQTQAQQSTQPSNLPSGVLLRDKSDGRVYFIDKGTKRLITTPAAFTPGSGYVDVDSSLLVGLPKGADITSKPPFSFKSKADTEKALTSAGIDFSKKESKQVTKPSEPPKEIILQPLPPGHGLSPEEEVARAAQEQLVPPGAEPPATRQQIKDPEDLKKYTEDQIIREQDGKIYLKSGVAVAEETKKDLTDTSVLPDFIKNSDVFKALSAQNQGLVAVQWNGIQATSALDKIRINEALKEATKLADPLFKQSILLARDTLERNLKDILATNQEAKDKLEMELSIMKEDFITKSSRLNEAERESALKDLETISIVKDQAIREGESREAGVAADIRRINRRVEAINDDLKSGRGDIAIEEQAQLARYLKDYQRTLQTTQEQAVDAGLGFSSIRTEAEKRLAEDLQDVSESTRRQKSRELRSLESQSGRQTSELVATQADIDRKNQEMRVDLAKQMEQKLGYSAVPDDIRKYLPGPTIINKEGTVLRGEAERIQQERARELQQKEEDIKTSTKRAEADAQRQRQIFEREREKSVEQQKRMAEELLGSEEAQKTIPGGPAPLGGITGTLEREKTENVRRIGQSLFDTGFTPPPEETKKPARAGETFQVSLGGSETFDEQLGRNLTPEELERRRGKRRII